MRRWRRAQSAERHPPTRIFRCGQRSCPIHGRMAFLPVLHSMALFWGATTQRIESFMGGAKVSHPSVSPSWRAECRLGVGEVRRSPLFLGSDFRKLHVLHLNLFPSFHGPNKSPG